MEQGYTVSYIYGEMSLSERQIGTFKRISILFVDFWVYNIEGVDTYNACYGGTSALFNTINWIQRNNMWLFYRLSIDFDSIDISILLIKILWRIQL